MKAVLLEIRDRGTTIPALAISTDGHPILHHAGYAPDGKTIIVVMLALPKVEYDPFEWVAPERGRTMHHAHLWIESHFSELKDGDVVDVEFILGETTQPKTAEIGHLYEA